MVATTSRDDMPDYFYISIGLEQYHIGCAVMHREDGVLQVRYIKEQPEAFMRAVAGFIGERDGEVEKRRTPAAAGPVGTAIGR